MTRTMRTLGRATPAVNAGRPARVWAALAFLALATCARAPEQPRPAALTPEERAWLEAHGPLRFAPDPAFPPIEWVDETGTYRGLVADTFQLIEARLGARIEIVRAASWEEVLRRARAREIDGITAAQPTPARSAYLDWTPPLLDLPNVVIARTEATGDLSLEGLHGRSVAVTSGNALEEFLRVRHPGIHLVALPDDLSCLTAVSFGSVDATVVNLAIASYLIEQNGITNLRVVGDSGRGNPLAIATRNDQPLLRSIMAKGLAAVTPAEREAIARRWIRIEAGDLVSRRSVLRWLAAGLGSLVLLGALALAWTVTLRRRVATATAGLQAELAERHRAEAALRRAERKLALHLAQTVVAVIEWDLDFRVAYWNGAAERLFGWSQAEAMAQPGDLIVPAARRAQVSATWRSLLERTGGWHAINENVTRDGRTITCEWFNTSLLDDDGKVSGVMSLATDVSGRERKEEAQVRAQRLESLAVMAGGIAHDFNNILTGILGNLSLALDDQAPRDETHKLLEEALSASMRAQTLTRQLLTFSRGGAPAKAVLDLGPLVREAAIFASRGAAGTCRFEVPGDLWTVEADPGQLGQVVQNLVLNALEASPGGTVEVSLANVELEQPPSPLTPGPHVRLRIADHGPGIAPDDLPRIFDPFFSTKRRGSGLGLAVTHSIVTRHGGRVDVGSKPGQGTVFEVVLPAAPGGRPEVAVASDGPAPARARVLVMDDEEPIRRVARRILAGMGCEVAVAADGAEAVATWQAWREAGRPFDLVVLDLTVPGGMGGVETLAALRALDPDVRAAVSSGYSNHAAMGFDAVIPKPWSASDLRRVVGELVSGHD